MGETVNGTSRGGKTSANVAFPAWQLCALALCLLAFLASSRQARAAQGYYLSGGDGGPDGASTYMGIIYAPWSNLSDDGLIARLWAKTFRFAYSTSLPGKPKARIDAVGYGLEGEIGWQLTFAGSRIALYAGAAWRDHVLTPKDPGSNLTHARLSASVALDGEYVLSDRYGVMSNASFLSGTNQYWAQLRPWFKHADNWKAGPDFAISGGKNYTTIRAGVFLSSYQLNLDSWGTYYAGAQSGAQISLSGKKITPYIGVNIGRLF